MNQIPILYENSEIYIINKPSGVSVQGGAGVTHPLDEILAQQVGAKVFPVHRLDKDTAGILVVAKNHDSASKWTKLFSGKLKGKSVEIKKEYIAFCIGKFPKSAGTINAQIFEHGQNKNAVTNYKVEDTWNCNEIAVSKVRLLLETGRMHQIRIHLAKIGCPIVGDDKHGDFRMNKVLRKEFGAKNLMLAAVSLSLPIGGKQQTFAVQLPFHITIFQSKVSGTE